MRETALVVRRLLAGEKVTFTGETLHIENARLDAPPAKPPPIYMAALNKKMLRLAGEVADGVILNLFGPEHLSTVLEEVAAGAESAQRDLSDIEVVIRLQVAVNASPESGRALARAAFGPYIAASGYNTFYRWIGFEREAEAVAEAMQQGRREEVKAAISDELADALVVHGSPADCHHRFGEYLQRGADTIVTMPLATSAEGCWETLSALAPRSMGG
jgi:alkanesulfonate monooxygenase SsuD/methylene tetrahydromethanopterin reductase-like flavin-dependent oxidoreductase (luciferase family)